MLDAYIYDGARTPFGRHAGSLSKVRPDDMLASVIKDVVSRSPFAAEAIDDVNVGCASQAGEDSRCIARHAILLAGLPIDVPGAVYQRNCGSGLNAIISSAHAITCGEGDLYVAGGVEHMTRAPYVMSKPDSAFGRDAKLYDTTIGVRFPNARAIKQYGNHSMPETGDNVAKDFGITREQADEFALASQQKYATAEKEGFYKGEIMPITLPAKKKVRKFCETLRELTDRRLEPLDAEVIVGRLNQRLRGWANYFRLGPVGKAYRRVNYYVTNRLRRWLCSKHKMQGAGWTRFPNEYLYEKLGLFQLRACRAASRVRTHDGG